MSKQKIFFGTLCAVFVSSVLWLERSENDDGSEMVDHSAVAFSRVKSPVEDDLSKQIGQMESQLRELREDLKLAHRAIASLSKLEGQGRLIVDGSEDVEEADAKLLEDGYVSTRQTTQWMNEQLDFDRVDQELTEEVGEQLADTLSKSPGISLYDLRCGEGFCRALFTSSDGRSPNLDSLIGLPPFTSEMLTEEKSQGLVSVYFPEQGKSINELHQNIKR